MSAAQRMKELHAQKADLFKQAEAALAANDDGKFDEVKAKIDATNKAIDRAQFLLDAEMAQPVSPDPERDAHLAAEKAGKPGVFKTLGEQLQAVHTATLTGRQDPRLFKASQGLEEATPSSGGFAVQADFSSEILNKMYETGQVLQRCRRVSVQGNGIVVPAIDETSRANGSRLGGVRGYWVEEGSAPTASKPKLRQLNMRLAKVAALGYATDELLQDAPALSSIMNQGAAEELVFVTEDAIINGDGAGKPLGILTGPCLVTASKKAAQAATTFVVENVAAMWARLWARGRNNAVWFHNQAVDAQFHIMTAATAPVYMPNGNVAGSPFGTLYGRPVIPVEYAAALGTAGDVILADMSEYLLIEKGGVESASSMHVAFDTFEQAFRFSYRVNGQPTWNSALTPFKGSDTLSPFVVVEAR